MKVITLFGLTLFIHIFKVLFTTNFIQDVSTLGLVNVLPLTVCEREANNGDVSSKNGVIVGHVSCLNMI